MFGSSPKRWFELLTPTVVPVFQVIHRQITLAWRISRKFSRWVQTPIFFPIADLYVFFSFKVYFPFLWLLKMHEMDGQLLEVAWDGWTLVDIFFLDGRHTGWKHKSQTRCLCKNKGVTWCLIHTRTPNPNPKRPRLTSKQFEKICKRRCCQIIQHHSH
jgi:hypothetical protein